MRDTSVVRLAGLVDGGHIRVDANGTLQVRTIGATDREWVRVHRDAIAAALTPYSSDEAIGRICAVFPGTTVTDPTIDRTARR